MLRTEEEALKCKHSGIATVVYSSNLDISRRHLDCKNQDVCTIQEKDTKTEFASRYSILDTILICRVCNHYSV